MAFPPLGALPGAPGALPGFPPLPGLGAPTGAPGQSCCAGVEVWGLREWIYELA